MESTANLVHHVEAQRTNNYEVIEVVVDLLNSSPMKTQLQRILHCVENRGGRVEVEMQQSIAEHIAAPSEAQQRTVVGVDWNQTVGRLDVHFGHEGASA